jgi:hypothetical protein
MDQPRLYDEWSYPLLMVGMAVGCQPEQVDDPVARLHEVVREVTGNAVEPSPKPRIGFLP